MFVSITKVFRFRPKTGRLPKFVFGLKKLSILKSEILGDRKKNSILGSILFKVLFFHLTKFQYCIIFYDVICQLKAGTKAFILWKIVWIKRFGSSYCSDFFFFFYWEKEGEGNSWKIWQTNLHCHIFATFMCYCNKHLYIFVSW